MCGVFMIIPDVEGVPTVATKASKNKIIYNPSKQKSDLFAVAHYAGEV